MQLLDQNARVLSDALNTAGCNKLMRVVCPLGAPGHAYGITSDERTLLLLHISGVAPTCKTVALQSIVRVDVETDTMTVTTGQTSGRVGQAALGGIVAGPAGAIVGAAGSRQTQSLSEEIITGARLKLTIDNPSEPLLYLPVSDLSQANEWKARLDVLRMRAHS